MASSERGIVGWLALGLLLDGPASGYDLWHRAERSVAHFWPVTKSALYAELPRLEDRGLASSTEVSQRNYPDKRIYAATEAGRAAFVDWLTSVELAERPRHPQQLLLFFAAHAPAAHTQRLLAGWRRQAEQVRENCRQILFAKGIQPDGRQVPVPADPRLLTALFGMRRSEADLAFLDEIAATFRATGDARPDPSDTRVRAADS
ncbi:PadR family transcriptional regulator [Micromonospora sp. R77]|uniref:PadR family transcriptional regulator n=1 Tax=Micromonospora sp. R77 TaxID=2925836 RepID=UPI001F6025D9|nr:PadR family transcriptional regulator [Micromonospora sp. R77]MCI4066645.1 PadR family transcriptional regulator [Micromonospora sp. R77]